MTRTTIALLGALGLATAAAQPGLSQTDFAKITAGVAAYESGAGAEPLRQVEELVRTAGANPSVRQELEAALAAVLDGKATFEGKRFACQYLAIIGSDASLPALGRLLIDKETAGIACLALGSHPSAKAGETLRNALPRLEGAALAQALGTLGDRRDTAAVPALAQLAAGKDTAAAEAAIAALGKIGDAPARSAIANLRKSAGPALAAPLAEASLRAAERLAADGDRNAAAALYADFLAAAQPAHIRRAALQSLLRLDADGGEQRILDVMRGGDGALKPAAIAGIATLKSPGASEKFAAEMAELPAELQVLLIGALGARGDAPARRAIAAQAQSARPEVALAAIRSLGAVGDASSVPVLAAIVAKGGPPEPVRAALASLQLLKDAAADDAILAAARQASPAARADLIDVLAARQAASAVPFLFEQAGRETGRPAAAALRGLGRLASPQQLDALVDVLFNLQDPRLEEDAATAVVQVARKIADPAKQSETLLAAYRKAPAVPARCALLRVLAGAGGAPALDAALAALRDVDDTVRDAAVRALANWSDPAAANTVLDQARAASDPTRQVLLLRGAIRLLGLASKAGDKGALASFAGALDIATRPEEKRLVAAALSDAPMPGAIGLIAPMLDDPALESEAALAVLSIAKAGPGTAGPQAAAALEKSAALLKDPAQQKEARALLARLKPAAPAPASGAPWRPLFDGKTLAGWHPVGAGKWTVEDGAIVGRANNEALYGLLVSDAPRRDFTVRFKFKCLSGDSGFYIRTIIQEPEQAHGLQVQVGRTKSGVGGIYESYGRKWISKPSDELEKSYTRDDAWNEMIIDARGGNILVQVNGIKSAELKDDPARAEGHFALQMHSKCVMQVLFKDIAIRE